MISFSFSFWNCLKKIFSSFFLNSISSSSSFLNYSNFSFSSFLNYSNFYLRMIFYYNSTLHKCQCIYRYRYKVRSITSTIVISFLHWLKKIYYNLLRNTLWLFIHRCMSHQNTHLLIERLKHYMFIVPTHFKSLQQKDIKVRLQGIMLILVHWYKYLKI